MLLPVLPPLGAFMLCYVMSSFGAGDERRARRCHEQLSERHKRMRRLFPPPPAGTPRPKLPEGSTPLLVIGLVGGEAHGPHAWSSRLTEAAPVYRVPGSASSPACELCMHHDQHHGVLYLSLSSSTASQALLEQADVLARATSKHAVHAWLVEKSTEHVRALLLLFHLSHAVLVLSDARCVDVGLLRQLRSLHTLKQAVQPTVQVALKPVLHPAGRGGGQRSDAQLPTLPALGFVFASPPVPSPDAPGADGGPSARSRLEAALEAQVHCVVHCVAHALHGAWHGAWRGAL